MSNNMQFKIKAKSKKLRSQGKQNV